MSGDDAAPVLTCGQPSDVVLAKKVREAVDDLNNRVQEAANNGVTTEIEVQYEDVMLIGRARAPRVAAKISRNL